LSIVTSTGLTDLSGPSFTDDPEPIFVVAGQSKTVGLPGVESDTDDAEIEIIVNIGGAA